MASDDDDDDDDILPRGGAPLAAADDDDDDFLVAEADENDASQAARPSRLQKGAVLPVVKQLGRDGRRGSNKEEKKRKFAKLAKKQLKAPPVAPADDDDGSDAEGGRKPAGGDGEYAGSDSGDDASDADDSASYASSVSEIEASDWSEDDEDQKRKKGKGKAREGKRGSAEGKKERGGDKPVRAVAPRKRSALSEDDEPPAADPRLAGKPGAAADDDEDDEDCDIAAAVAAAAAASQAKAAAAKVDDATKYKNFFTNGPKSAIDSKLLKSHDFLVVGSIGQRSSWKLPYRDRHGRVNVHLLEVARATIKSGQTARGKPLDFVITPAVAKRVDEMWASAKLWHKAYGRALLDKAHAEKVVQRAAQAAEKKAAKQAIKDKEQAALLKAEAKAARMRLTPHPPRACASPPSLSLGKRPPRPSACLHRRPPSHSHTRPSRCRPPAFQGLRREIEGRSSRAPTRRMRRGLEREQPPRRRALALVARAPAVRTARLPRRLVARRTRRRRGLRDTRSRLRSRMSRSASGGVTRISSLRATRRRAMGRVVARRAGRMAKRGTLARRSGWSLGVLMTSSSLSTTTRRCARAQPSVPMPHRHVRQTPHHPPSVALAPPVDAAFIAQGHRGASMHARQDVLHRHPSQQDHIEGGPPSHEIASGGFG